jgi:hypothetical protein
MSASRHWVDLARYSSTREKSAEFGKPCLPADKVRIEAPCFEFIIHKNQSGYERPNPIAPFLPAG